MKFIISHVALLFLIANPYDIGCDANYQAADASAQCGGLCELCVALIPSPQKGKPQIVFRDSLNTKNGASAACGSFNNKIMTEGWGHLHVRTNEKVADDQQAWAAGFVEGCAIVMRVAHAEITSLYSIL